MWKAFKKWREGRRHRLYLRSFFIWTLNAHSRGEISEDDKSRNYKYIIEERKKHGIIGTL